MTSKSRITRFLKIGSKMVWEKHFRYFVSKPDIGWGGLSTDSLLVGAGGSGKCRAAFCTLLLVHTHSPTHNLHKFAQICKLLHKFAHLCTNLNTSAGGAHPLTNPQFAQTTPVPKKNDIWHTHQQSLVDNTRV